MPDIEMVDEICDKTSDNQLPTNKKTTNIDSTLEQTTIDTKMESDKDESIPIGVDLIGDRRMENSFDCDPKYKQLFFDNKKASEVIDMYQSIDDKVQTDNQTTTTADSGATAADELMEEDNSHSEATFSFKITDVTNFFNSTQNKLSDPCYIRNLPWKIMAMPRHYTERNTRSLGFFLQCNGESNSPLWSCHAFAELKLINQLSESGHMTRKIEHLFLPKENDWGFTQFISYKELMAPEKGFCKDDTIILQVHVKAEVPHGIQWDSKKYTGYVGLKNQGATCYMNSLLQTLFFTNKLRKAVYLMPTEFDDSSKSVALALQRVFYELQFNDKPVGTKKLTKSFGWDTLDSFMQHDVQELCRVLLDNIESKMKNTCVAGTIPQLFEGKMISFIRCKHVDFHSKRVEPFYDIQLNIKGKNNIYDSFEEYISVETLDGENKYDAGDFGMQEAEKGIVFESFPPVLHLHLLRFQYDPLTDNNVKINDRFEFDEEINLSRYLKSNNSNLVEDDNFKEAPYSFATMSDSVEGNNNNESQESESAIYILHAVLVHSGDNHGGHYVVFINPKGDGNWCKFDDDVVSLCNKTEAISNNFGGTDDETSKHCTNAYMLVYIRKDSNVLEPVTEDLIPIELVERLKEEKRQEGLRRKERLEQHLYLTISAYTECSFMGHRGSDLFDLEKAICKTFKIEKSATYHQTLCAIGAEMNYPPEGIRLWQIVRHCNDTYRPSALQLTDNKDRSIQDILGFSPNGCPNSYLFIELARPTVPIKPLPEYEADSDTIILFFKYYDPVREFITYCGYEYINKKSKFTSLVPILNAKVGLDVETPLLLYREIRLNSTYQVTDLKATLEKAFLNLMNGDIICFQKDELSSYSQSVKLPTVADYFRDLNNRIEVLFCDKNIANDAGFTLKLSKNMTYDELSAAVAQRLNTEPDLIQFHRTQCLRNEPSTPVNYNFEGTLKDLFATPKPKPLRKLLYQLLTINIKELEFKKQFKCIWVNSKLKEERELLLFPNRSGTVEDLLEEAKKYLCETVYCSNVLSPEGSGKLRLLEMTSNRIVQILKEEVLVECLNISACKSFRIEEIPKDELELDPNEFLMPVAHFHKEVIHTFGTPFLLKIRQKELFSQIKSRIQKKLDMSDKEFEKYKFALVTGSRPQYFDDQIDNPVNKEEFQMHMAANNTQALINRPWLGLEHMNKAPKRSRYNYLQKAIKIHN